MYSMADSHPKRVPKNKNGAMGVWDSFTSYGTLAGVFERAGMK